jgi:gamma-glutamylcyclotransferase (GGCT)/AIG2-like uncharacterized protein YtfP
MSDLQPLHRIFVYGTLRRTDPSQQHTRLGEAKYLGLGRVCGQLLHLGAYPGATPSTTESIVGEIYELADFPIQIAQLDTYEGCDPGTPPPQEYRRATTPVTLPDGSTTTAWIYWWQANAQTTESDPPKIPSGDWLEHPIA